jgi:hypothetical protein
MSGWVSCWLRKGGGPAGPPAAPRLLSCRDYHYSRIIYFGQMRHELYERLGELLATRGGAALLGLQLLPASYLAGTTIIQILNILSDETRPV